MKKSWSEVAWDELCYWLNQDKKTKENCGSDSGYRKKRVRRYWQTGTAERGSFNVLEPKN